MGAKNIIRLWTAGLAGSTSLDLESGEALSFLPEVDDQGSIEIGDGTTDMDVKIFLGSANEFVLLDVGNSRIDIGQDDTGMDVRFFGATASSLMTWDESANQLLFDNADIQLGDSDELRLGDATGGDLRITWDGSRVTSGPAIAQSTTGGLWSGCPSAIDPDPYKQVVFMDDFSQGGISTGTPLALWTEIDDGGTGTNAYSSATTIHSAFNLVTAAADNDHHALFSAGFPFDLLNAKALWFEARFQISEATTNDSAWAFGLMEVTTTGGLQVDALGPLASYDGVVMWKDEDTMTLQCETSNAGTQDTENSLGTVVSGNWTRVGFHLTAAATTAVCHAYFDLSDTGTMTAHSATMNLTRAGLVPLRVFVCLKAGPGAAAETISIDYIKVVQER